MDYDLIQPMIGIELTLLSWYWNCNTCYFLRCMYQNNTSRFNFLLDYQPYEEPATGPGINTPDTETDSRLVSSERTSSDILLPHPADHPEIKNCLKFCNVVRENYSEAINQENACQLFNSTLVYNHTKINRMTKEYNYLFCLKCCDNLLYHLTTRFISRCGNNMMQETRGVPNKIHQPLLVLDYSDWKIMKYPLSMFSTLRTWYRM